MKGFPEMFCVWVTKQVSHFCGTNRQLSRFDTSVVNVCPSCGATDESPGHITRCKDEGRTQMFNHSVSGIVQWLEATKTNPSLVDLIVRYLQGRGEVRMQSLVGRDSRFRLLAKFHDLLGWDNFVEGRLCKLWLELREVDISTLGLRSTAESWATGLSRRLLELTHRQLIYRNSVVHFKVEGLTLNKHGTIMDSVERLAATDPADLLPDDRRLLSVDFDALGRGAATARRFWVAEMESAVAAAQHVSRGSTQTLRSRYQQGAEYSTRRTTVAAAVDTEGSIKWRRRRRREI